MLLLPHAPSSPLLTCVPFPPFFPALFCLAAPRPLLLKAPPATGRRYISLAETDKGLRDILKLEEVFDCKPAIMRAFQAAKDVHKESKARLGADFVTKCEFRILLEYLRKYFELFVMFDRMDDDNDRRLSEEVLAPISCLMPDAFCQRLFALPVCWSVLLLELESTSDLKPRLSHLLDADQWNQT